jgi:hypothetical protein
MSTASVVGTSDAFMRAAGSDGTWITEALRDSFEMDDASEVTGETRIGTR